MPVVRVSSLDDPGLADYRSVREPTLIRERGLFVAEGRLVVERLLGLPRYTVESLLLTDAAWAALQPRIGSRVTCPVYLAESADMFRALTGYAVHRGCLALARLPTEQPAETLLKHARTVVVLESVSNPDNLGGVFRNAAAFGVDAVLLNRACCSPFYRKAVRTSMGATLQVPFSWLEPWPDGLDALDEAGITLVALTPRQPGLTLDQFAGAIRSSRMALLVGSEGLGLSDAAESRAHTRVRIPIAPDVDSLNLAVACGIALSRLAIPASAIEQS